MKKLRILFVLLCIQIISYAQSSNEYQVYAIRFAKSGFLKLSEVAIGGSEKDGVADCFMFWLLKGNGRNIIVGSTFPGLTIAAKANIKRSLSFDFVRELRLFAKLTVNGFSILYFFSTQI